KRDPRTRHIPIIVVTALNEVGDVERAVDCGADDFLTKPVQKIELLTRVRSLLRVSRLQRELEAATAKLREAKRQRGGEGGGVRGQGSGVRSQGSVWRAGIAGAIARDDDRE